MSRFGLQPCNRLIQISMNTEHMAECFVHAMENMIQNNAECAAIAAHIHQFCH